MRILGREYFQLGIPCPFLEEESCSIYHDRPITCREYLVTSPPAALRIFPPQKISAWSIFPPARFGPR